MKDEKQIIEEMAKDVTRSISWCDDVIPTVDCLGTAAALYGIGYRKQSGWISVDESLPEEYDIILCFNGSYVQSSVFLDGEFIEDDKYEGDPIRGVTHWMPFPQGPKGGAECE